MSPQVAYLLARIAEEEAEACEAQAKGEQGYHLPDWPIAAKTDRDYLDAFVAVHPDRVLAECKAKRRIVEEYVEAAHLSHRLQDEGSDEKWEWMARATALENVVRIHTVPYADHPDFDPTWKD